MVLVDEDQVDIVEMPKDNEACVSDSQLNSASLSSDCYDSLNDTFSSCILHIIPGLSSCPSKVRSHEEKKGTHKFGKDI